MGTLAVVGTLAVRGKTLGTVLLMERMPGARFQRQAKRQEAC
jgi:hypothetical protein